MMLHAQRSLRCYLLWEVERSLIARLRTGSRMTSHRGFGSLHGLKTGECCPENQMTDIDLEVELESFVRILCSLSSQIW